MTETILSKQDTIDILRSHILLLEKELSIEERINSCENAFCIMAKNIEWLLSKVTELKAQKEEMRAERKAFEKQYQAFLNNGDPEG